MPARFRDPAPLRPPTPMRLELTGRHIQTTPALRASVNQQLAPILRLLNDGAVSAQVVLTQERTRVHCEATLHARGEKFLHGEGAGRDAEAALAGALSRIRRQAEKVKGKWTGRRRRVAAPDAVTPPVERAAATADEPRVRVIRARRYAVKPMTIDEAAMQMVDGDQPWLVFRNAVSDEVAVMFRRPDGHLGLIEP